MSEPYKRTNYASGTKWEPVVGYSRAVRKGPFVFVTGTTATDDSGAITNLNDPYGQARQCINNIQKALKAVNADLNDVVRTRIYVKNIEHWKEIGRAHQEFFAKIMPATSMIEVSRLIDDAILVEIEADAIADE